ncbi:MAG TPA: ADP-forming succinate--CoA ligase subunit beta, partial [Anaerolineae bacterium]|nr:ADP-forming succinate--CoA ligase subunit beta [Anaerolineae bacterium]
MCSRSYTHHHQSVPTYLIAGTFLRSLHVNLNEYQAKRLFGQYGVPVPVGDVATTPAEARAIAEKLGGKVIVKAQVLIGGRGKAGGVKLAVDPADAEAKAAEILGMDIKGFTVHKVLLDPAADIADELYLAIMVDRSKRQPMIMASAEGGMDIEQVNAETPEKIIKVHINPNIGLKRYHSVQIASQMGLGTDKFSGFHKVLNGLYNCFVSTEATLTEVNPLIIQGDGTFSAIDGKMTVDDSALARHPKIAAMRDPDDLTENEKRAKEAGINYIQLDGNIGCLVNGAGLAMTSMDVINFFGGNPANFLDIGGGAKAEAVTAALNIILGDPHVQAVLINIFGGITRCDGVAKGILQALDNIDTDVPFV